MLSGLLLETRVEALNFLTGKIELGFCATCGFVFNTVFQPELHNYSSKYAATQSYSPTFNKFHRGLAQRLIDRYELNDKDVIEIGCGQGEFLILLCEMGPNRGVGFDPAYNDYRLESEAKERIQFVKDFYSEKYTETKGDFLCCKMTLEHIPDTAVFVNTVRRSIADKLDTTVFFQVPNAAYVLGDIAFWDVYYEHCSYFSLGSLARLFRQSNFDVLDLMAEYDDQYIKVEAKPTNAPTEAKLTAEDDIAQIKQLVERFEIEAKQSIDNWRSRLDGMQASGKKVVIWGSGSKGVTFLNTLGITDEIGYAVDINPHKHGTFMAGTGHEIVGPELLLSYQPDVVIVMNPIYCPEIQADLDRLGVKAELLSVEQ